MIVALTVSLFPSSGMEPNKDKRSKDTKKSVKEDLLRKNDLDDSFFKAVGHEPNWNISISKKGIVYYTAKPSEKVIFPYVEAVLEGEARVYRTHTKREEIEIVIYEELTSDSLTGKEYDHSIAVRLEKHNASGSVINDFSGYGFYIYDSSLSGNWILKSFENKGIAELNIDQIPLICIDINTRSFSGSGGNHTIYGDLSCEGDSIFFKNVIAPEFVTDDFAREKELLHVLENANKFKLKDDELQLYIDKDQKMILVRDSYSY